MVEIIKTLDNLSEFGCSVKTDKYYIEGKEKFIIGDPHRISFENSENGREELQKLYPDFFAVLTQTTWGTDPKVIPHEPLL